MSPLTRTQVTWKRLFAQAGFPSYFTGMFVSLFGTGLNFAGVTLYVLAKTGSTVQVSFTVILLTLPRLVVPLFGGVLTDRMDRRYLGITLDVLRAVIVVGTAGLALAGRLELWQLYLMILLLGIAFAVYWSASLALLQEIVPPLHLVGANAAVLVAVQGGMLAAGAAVGVIYDRAGLAPILAIDGLTYLVSAFCWYRLRHGHVWPVRGGEDATQSPIVPLNIAEYWPAMLADIREGFRYLREQPSVFALGFTYASMMAGVISANVVVVALAHDVLHAGARGFGFLQSGWALGAVAGGLAALALPRQRRQGLLIMVLMILALGHALFPYAGWIAVAIAMNVVFGACRAVGAVLTQSAILRMVPHHLMGRIQSVFALIATILQIVMSFALGWLAEHTSLEIAFALLGLLYGLAAVAAMRASAVELAGTSSSVPG